MEREQDTFPPPPQLGSNLFASSNLHSQQLLFIFEDASSL